MFWVQETANRHNNSTYRNFYAEYIDDIDLLPTDKEYGKPKHQDEQPSNIPAPGGPVHNCQATHHNDAHREMAYRSSLRTDILHRLSIYASTDCQPGGHEGHRTQRHLSEVRDDKEGS